MSRADGAVRTIGMIGGGQLGRMIGAAASELGLSMIVLDPQAGCPAAAVAIDQLVADYDDHDALDELAKRCDVVTYEFENVPDAAVAQLEPLVPVHPGGRALQVSQDRLIEKRFLTEHGIGTAPFIPVDNQTDLIAAVESLGGNAVIKTRRFGYDGKGQLRIRGGAVAGDAFESLGGVPLIAEGWVEFASEVSVIAVRSASGEIRTFDPSTNHHEDGILVTSTVPAGIDTGTRAATVAAATRLAEALDYVGVLGLELFVLDDGEVLANEFAPRVHNSGHWTSAACVCSQFEQHVRAIAGWPLGSTDRWADAIMTNLIGDDIESVPELATKSDHRVTVYGKAETRPGRKMGHVTWVTSR